VIEDTSVTATDIRSEFGEGVLALVEGASEPDKAGAWEERKQHTLDYLGEAPLDVCVVVCADKLDNLDSLGLDKERLGDGVWLRFNRGADAQRWYFQGLSDALAKRGSENSQLQSLAGRLASTVASVFDS
jgi:(p)ppGpp synthase/HD superfamily hydrolase